MLQTYSEEKRARVRQIWLRAASVRTKRTSSVREILAEASTAAVTPRREFMKHPARPHFTKIRKFGRGHRRSSEYGTGDAREGEGLVDFQRIKHRIL